MKYKNAIEDVRNIIASVIKQENNNKELYNSLIEKVNEKMKVSKLASLFNDQVQIEMFKVNELYYLLKALHELKKEKKFIAEDYFTKGEIDNIESEPIEINEGNDVIELHEVVETIPDEQWIAGKVKVKDIISYLYNGLLSYDPRVQRETKKVKMRSGGFVERISVNEKSVREIKEALLKGEYIPTAISLNILKVGSIGDKVYDFKQEDRVFTILKNDDVKIQIIDGFHRIKGMLVALEENPNLESVMQVNIFYKDLAGAGRYIIQQSKGNKISTAKLKALNTEDIAVNIVNDINKTGTTKTNFMFGKIGIDKDDIELMDKFTTVEILSSSINKYWQFNEKDLRSQRKLKEYLINFYNEVISIFSNEFDSIKESRKTFALTQAITFGGLVALAKKLEDVEGWEDKLDDILENTNWKLSESNTWEGMNITNMNLPPRQLKKMYATFENLYKNEELVSATVEGGV